jgi:hypothetical protein
VEKDAYPWKVTVTYPWSLIEMLQESSTDRIPFIIAVDKAAEHRGGQRVGNSHDPHFEHRGDRNSEWYAFPNAYKAESFVVEVRKLLETCGSSGLQKLADRYKDRMVGWQYAMRVWMDAESL